MPEFTYSLSSIKFSSFDVALVFYKPTPIRVTRNKSNWSVRGLEIVTSSPHLHSALEEWALAVRSEAERLLCTPTHVLEAADRTHKRRILGAVDVLESEVGPRSEVTWVAGPLEREGEDVVLVTSDGERYPLEAHLCEGVDMSGPYRVGKIALDRRCRPYGKVFELDPRPEPLDSDAVWAKWKRLVYD